jgi:general secretion pathway protein F/type IV pilus assembly protein PilC
MEIGWTDFCDRWRERIASSTFAFRRATAADRRSLLRLIAVAAEERISLMPLLEAQTRDARGTHRRRMARLLKNWDSKISLVSAIEQTPRLLTDEQLLAIQFGTQMGALARSLRAQIAREDIQLPLRMSLRRTIWYCAGTFLAILAVSFFIHIKLSDIFPKIYGDFGVEVPPIVGIAKSWNLAVLLEQFWWIGALLALLVVWSYFSTWPGRFLRNSIVPRFSRPIRELRATDLLDKLRLAVEAGRPLAGALSTLARYHYDPAIRRKLLFVRNEVEQGADVWESMESVGLLNDPEQRALATAEKLGNRDWVLDLLARNKQRKSQRRLERLAELLWPACIVLLGALVLVQCLAVMVPLLHLIWSLT